MYIFVLTRKKNIVYNEKKPSNEKGTIMHKILNSTKSFIIRNKATLVTGAALSAVVVLQARGLTSMGEFLKEKGLYEEYFHLDEI